MADPFLSIDDFADEFRGDLSDGDTLVATRLLQVVSDWIRDRKADVDPTAAAQVLFEVVRDAANYGEFERLSTFTNTTVNRTEAGSFDNSRAMVKRVVDDYITDRHKRLLGIPLKAAPAYSFPVRDY